MPEIGEIPKPKEDPMSVSEMNHERSKNVSETDPERSKNHET